MAPISPSSSSMLLPFLFPPRLLLSSSSTTTSSLTTSLLRSSKTPASSSIFSSRPRISVRHAATSRRTTKILRPKPASNSLPKPAQSPSRPTRTSPLGLRPASHLPDHIIFNPPSSTPTPYQTPPIFLPQNDIRRTLLAKTTHAITNPYAANPARVLPPPIKPIREKTYNLSAEQIEHMRVLRTQDPFTWTRKKLADKFACSEYFVGMCVQASKERMEWAWKVQDQIKAKWGARKMAAREDRGKRRELWGRDE